MIKVFISYSWDSIEHKEWIKKLADSLEENSQFHIHLDQYDLGYQDDKNQYMERAISESDVLVIVATEGYKNKANNRSGGVGIETRLVVPNYWERLASNNKSGVIVLLRENDATPDYLKNQFHIDFTIDEKYNQCLHELTKALTNNEKSPRPPKRSSFEKNTAQYNFTRAEDMLKLAYKRREAIITGSTGIDFSGSNRIRFELWKITSPIEAYYLILFDNITITQTINRACDLIKSNRITPQIIHILRPNPGEQNLVKTIFHRNDIQADIKEFTYSEFLWEYCIDDDLKDSSSAYRIPYYIEQPVKLRKEDGERIASASKLVFSKITTERESIAHLILAPGGMGKTALCHQLISLLNSNSSNQAVVNIQADHIRDRLEHSDNMKVETIFDLYAVYASKMLFEKHFDKTSFELAVLSGNLVVIIDGLDEIASILEHGLNKQTFFKSLLDLHSELGESSVIITSRTLEGFSEINLENYGISVYDLIGFDTSSCNKYFAKRFSKKTNCDQLIEKSQRIIEKLIHISGHGSETVLPFFVDLIAKINEEESLGLDTDLETLSVSYKANSSIIDKLVAAVLTREQRKHSIDSEIECSVLREAAVEQGATINKSYIREWFDIYCGEKSEHIYNKLLLSPLLIQTNEPSTRFRYDFLHGYFYFLFVLAELHAGRDGAELLKAIRNISHRKDVAKWLKEYYQNHPTEIYQAIKTLVFKFRNGLKRTRESKDINGYNSYRDATASLLWLYDYLTDASREKLTNAIYDFYEVDSSPEKPRRIDDLHLTGDIAPINFNSIEIWHSTFKNWPRFVSCHFNSTTFFYSAFEIEPDDRTVDTSLTQSIFDQTCDTECFNWLFAERNKNDGQTRKLILEALAKFFKKFYQNTQFTDNKMQYIYFNEKIWGLRKQNFALLISNGIIEVCREKSDETYYQIPQKLHDSVFSFLNNSTISHEIDRIYKFITNK